MTHDAALPMTAKFPDARTSDDIRRNLAQVRARIDAACARAGRGVDDVHLLPVSKTVAPDVIRAAHAAGCRRLGENKVQEAWSKSRELDDLDIGWSIIGHLQTNKAKVVARFASEFQALDSLRVAEQLDRRLQLEGRGLDVLIQINSSGEPSKYGIAPEDLAGFAAELPAFSSLRVRGLMTLAAMSADARRVRRCFVLMRRLRERMREEAPAGMAFDELSMGMSGDFEIAVEEGATVVRVGQAIFGARALPDSHYWPAGER